MPQQEKSFRTTFNHPAALDYLLYTPPDYNAQDEWPLILFLHGYGERGSDVQLVAKHGPPKLVAAGDDFPFVIVSPQCPDTTAWPEQVWELNALLDHIIATCKVDTRRVYLTGLSMGGYGTFYMASRFPARFAAMAPICGGGRWWMPENLSQIPAWVFHGDADEVVPVAESEHMVDRIREAGGDIKLTIYPGVGHDSWTQTYSNPELYDWFLSHQRKG